jgi:hypothetical protein
MNRNFGLVAAGIALVAAIAACAPQRASSPPPPQHINVPAGYAIGPISFRRDVYPILQQNCAVCHTAGAAGYAQSGFSVQSYQSVMKGTKFGPVIQPYSSLSSTLSWLLEQGADPSINMPKEYSVVVSGHKNVIVPSKMSRPLSMNDLEVIEVWIDQGAKNN